MIDKKAEKLFGLLGYPVAHSMSPIMHNDQFKEKNLPYFYHAFNVHPDELGAAAKGLKALGISGFNVTVPHKVSIMEYLDEVDQEADIIGAVNTVVNEDGKWIGYNTDGRGYVDSLLRELGEKLKDCDVLVIGAGGAARAVITALASYGVKTITITNRTLSKAEKICERLPADSNNIRILSKEDAVMRTPDFDLIINTTSVGMHPYLEDTPWQTDQLKHGCLCSDLIYNPLKTKWLSEAEQAGSGILNGVGMFVGQGALAFQKWTGIKPNTDQMTETVLKQLGGKV